jgi:hypothetical protein
MNTFQSVGFATLLLFSASSADSQNLLTNPDFSQGFIGFTSQYQHVDFINTEGQFTTTPAGDINNVNVFRDWHNPGFPNSEHVLLANGAPTALVVWSQTVAVRPNTLYDFRYSAGDVNINDTSVATLQSTINGLVVSDLKTTSTAVRSSDARWFSGASTSATINMVDLNTFFGGNDFAMTNMSFTAPEPSTWVMMIAGFGALALVSVGRARASQRTVQV